MNIVVAQSGGPTAVINASLLGVFREAAASDGAETVFGALHGVEGLLNDRLVPLNDALAGEEAQALLRQTPSAALGSCRHKLPTPEEQPEVYDRIRQTLERHDIGGVFLIGGNDSMDTVAKLARYFAAIHSPIRVMGVPKTIDNDLVGTDHTPGYGSAAKYIATTVREIIRDCTIYDLSSVTIVEIMGRDTGWLTAAAALPRLLGEEAPHLIYLPEVPLTADRFIADVRRVQEHSKTVIVAVSEGVELTEVAEYQSGQVDVFGHKYLSGIGKCLERLVSARIGCKVRSVELNTPQRAAGHRMSATDATEAENAGRQAVRAALAGETGKMVTFLRTDDPYTVEFGLLPLDDVANRVKYVPREWINAEGNDVTPEAMRYIAPLVAGEVPLLTENGLPRHFVLKTE